uniref:Protein transport protein Sec16B n=1 Tax=Calidris pygmaea TaxID=425635 RepID=A0A8C3PQT3_9CHAR
MDPWAPAGPPQPWERQAARGTRGDVPHGPPPQHRSHLPGHPWDEGHHPRRDAHRPASRAEYYGSSYPNRPYSRQGYEDSHWQYPAANYGDDYAYQSHQWRPVTWQGDKPYGKTTNYQDQHYYRGYHPNLATPPLGQDRTQTYDSSKERYVSAICVFSLFLQPSGQPSLLLQYRESGLSSSSHELSQYIHDSADHYDPMLSGTWSLAQAGGPSVSTPALVIPLKFSLPHVAVCFGAGGQLVLVCPHHPAKGQLPHVQLHSLEVCHSPTPQIALGPLAGVALIVDVMTFCQQKIATSCDLSTQRGRDSALLWKLLVLLCRQNGSMVGSDTAELLMQDCRRQEKYKRQNPAANLIGLTDDEWMSRQPGTLDLITGEVPPVVETQAQIVEKFTKLLYYGRKKDALVWAMRNHLWGHALFLSSKMDPRTYSWVLTGFTSTLATNDPLQTFFQLMSGRIPQAALCCGDATWGDWRPHLAVLLSNKVGDMELNHRAMVTMGDTLAGKGAVEAAHFCYLMADIPFGYFGVKADRMALLGSSHRQAFAQFARTEVIQRMEIFEYCQQLRQPKYFLLPFQVYKLLYASRLADHGLPAQALQYCEQIATALLDQDPASHPVLAQQVMKLAERLKLSDPLLLEMPEQDQTLEPDWLVQLRACCQEWEVRRSGDAGGAAGLHYGDPGHELPQSKSYQYDQWYQAVPPQGPSSHEDMSLQPPARTATPPGGLFDEPPLQVVPTAACPDWGKTLLAPSQCGEESGWPPSPSHPFPLTVTTSISQSSGFRWFGWFRSKPTKESSPKASSETVPNSPTPEPEVGDERLSWLQVTPWITAMGTGDTSCPSTTIGLNDPKAGPRFFGAQPSLTPSLSLISQLAAASRPNQPRLLSQRRYPNLL